MVNFLNLRNYQNQVFIYLGNETQSHHFIANPGVYQIECWGAQGGYGGGKGGYVSGYIHFSERIDLYLHIGGEGALYSPDYSYNGGGISQIGGGGASDVRLDSKPWDNFESLKSRIIVAGGGGGFDSTNGDGYAGAAGGLEGQNSYNNNGLGGTQISGGSGDGNGTFGIGGSNKRISSKGEDDGNGAGGGGYFGGGASIDPHYNSGGGGSSYISGYDGCKAIEESSVDFSHYQMKEDSFHYSGYSFFKSIMLSGQENMPSPQGGIELGHSSYGAIRISHFIFNYIISKNYIHFHICLFVLINILLR